MITNIVEAVQKKLGYPPLQKVDPNIQETKEKAVQSTDEKLAQAAIPVVLAGFFYFTRSDEGAAYMLSPEKGKNWLDIIFGDKKQKAVEKVAHYAGIPVSDAVINMEEIAKESATLIHDGSGKTIAEKIKSFLSNQRHHILVHLPAALQLGDLLNDNAMDDRTNKMEGPVSSFMHKIEDKLSGGGGS